MAMKMKMTMALLLFTWVMRCFFLLGVANCQNNSYNVRNFGASGNGRTDDTQAFMSMWKVGCSATGDVKILIPIGVYIIGPVVFDGPCEGRTIFINLQGYLKATTNLQEYEDDEWVRFQHINNLSLAGGGTFDGQGSFSWPYNRCPKNKNCKILPVSLKFVYCTNTVLGGLTSVNSKFFHIGVLECRNFEAIGLKILAPGNSPNTDGIHVERSSDVRILNSTIATGDDCISVGHGNSQIMISGIICGPGHGISVGSLGRYPYEKDVKGLVVRECVLKGTQNGVRIKTWADSPITIQVSDMIFENITMINVSNPIIIDQTYCPYLYCPNTVPSSVNISNILYKNIKGTSKTPVAIAINCSKDMPCYNINFQNVHLDIEGGQRGTSHCRNALVQYSGIQIPPPCAT